MLTTKITSARNNPFFQETRPNNFPPHDFSMNLGLTRRVNASSASPAIDFELVGRVLFKVDVLYFLYLVTKRLYGTSNLTNV